MNAEKSSVGSRGMLCWALLCEVMSSGKGKGAGQGPGLSVTWPASTNHNDTNHILWGKAQREADISGLSVTP